MAYFPNGTSGANFNESTCVDCVHWDTRTLPLFGDDV